MWRVNKNFIILPGNMYILLTCGSHNLPGVEEMKAKYHIIRSWIRINCLNLIAHMRSAIKGIPHANFKCHQILILLLTHFKEQKYHSSRPLSKNYSWYLNQPEEWIKCKVKVGNTHHLGLPILKHKYWKKFLQQYLFSALSLQTIFFYKKLNLIVKKSS